MFLAFPLQDLLDENRCYQWLKQARWPEGKPVCPRCHATEGLYVHDRVKAPVEDWRCPHCGRVFNVFTETIFTRTRRSCAHIILILQGFAQGKSTNLLCRELGCEYDTLLDLRHRYQAAAREQCLGRPAFDATDTVEVDEMYQNAGEKKYPPSRSRGSAAPAGQQTKGSRHL
jgi:transposase-like protein